MGARFNLGEGSGTWPVPYRYTGSGYRYARTHMSRHDIIHTCGIRMSFESGTGLEAAGSLSAPAPSTSPLPSTSSPAPAQSEAAPRLKVKIKKWTAVAVWKWITPNDETECGICRLPFDGCCPSCKFPGDDCSLGELSFSFCVRVCAQMELTKFNSVLSIPIAFIP